MNSRESGKQKKAKNGVCTFAGAVPREDEAESPEVKVWRTRARGNFSKMETDR